MRRPFSQDHLIVCGVALGYADQTHPLSRHRTPREPVESLATFHWDEETVVI